jgi:L-arabinose isomerase
MQMMKKIKIGLVAVASHFEYGGERGDDLLSRAKKALESAGMEVAIYPRLIWDPADAIDACQKLKREEVNSLVMLEITWVLDSLKYIFTARLNLPTLFWAVPYTDTYSIAAVQHYCSILKAMGYTFEYVYGLPEETEVIKEIRSYAKVGVAVSAARDMIVGLVGPRQSWRVAGPQDMTQEEWDFSKKTGLTIVHIEMEEILGKARAISDADAKKTLQGLSARMGKSLLSGDAMLYHTKVYMAVKETMSRYRLDAAAAECYPSYGGQMNLAASWLADEGIVLDTEGDIGHSFVISTLNLFTGGGAAVLAEAGSIDVERNIIPVLHEGSSAMSLAGSLDKVRISPIGELGAYVGFPLKAMPVATVATIVGNGGNYKMLVAKGRPLDVPCDEWDRTGSRLAVSLQFDVEARSAMDQIIRGGMDHHIVIKEGDHTRELLSLCDFLGFETLQLR